MGFAALRQETSQKLLGNVPGNEHFPPSGHARGAHAGSFAGGGCFAGSSFYAAIKHKETGAEGFEPELAVATKSLGNKVEIRIRDNGTGIPLEGNEKIFKPAGEGTGLGLSMSHDTVVKQHGGTIDGPTEPDIFTEFIITLPRTGAAKARFSDRISRKALEAKN